MSISKSNKEIYGIPGSGWTSASWNWGSAQGTGHDCALICRRRYSSREARESLVQRLINAQDDQEDAVDIEELKLILGLSFQRGRWDGRDGGPGGYGQILTAMADAERYEHSSEQVSNKRLAEDMAHRFPVLLERMGSVAPEALQDSMQQCMQNPDPNLSLRRCSGLVLQTMRFIENGL